MWTRGCYSDSPYTRVHSDHGITPNFTERVVVTTQSQTAALREGHRPAVTGLVRLWNGHLEAGAGSAEEAVEALLEQ